MTSAAEIFYDIAIIGAGPAGLAAAAEATKNGARVALLDNGVRSGGQYWRNREKDSGTGHHDWSTYQRLSADLETHSELIDYLPQHSVWHVERRDSGFTSHATSTSNADSRIRSRQVIVATGAYDRQLPFPGWTLPGVFTAGAVQALLKGHGVLAGKRIAVSGTGPFLLAVAAGLVEAGADVIGVFEAGSPLGFAKYPMALARNLTKMNEGREYAAVLLQNRIGYHTRTAVVAAHGDGEVAGVTIAKLDRNFGIVAGSESYLDCDTVAVGYGFTPQLELPVQLGCDTKRDIDGSLIAVVDKNQMSTIDGVYIAGEACGVSGAAASVVEGRISGTHAAHRSSGSPADTSEIDRLRRQRSVLRSFAVAMHNVFPVPRGWTEWLNEDTVICRCEEVTTAAVKTAVNELGANDARAIKLYARPGMGLCQGRVCGYATSCLVAECGKREPTVEDLRGIASRPIAQPISLGQLAAGIDSNRCFDGTE
nr:FAD/NAD(P)-binding oxidoreductase [Rhodococcus sp. (in: high G+C Gram-positive bacteria)]